MLKKLDISIYMENNDVSHLILGIVLLLTVDNWTLRYLWTIQKTVLSIVNLYYNEMNQLLYEFPLTPMGILDFCANPSIIPSLTWAEMFRPCDTI